MANSGSSKQPQQQQPQQQQQHGKGRRLVDIAQKARGRTPLLYELEVIPFFAGELPSGLERACFTWERGSKLHVTEAELVNPHTRAVFWKQYLRQTATLYKEGGRLLPKEFVFKVQHLRGGGGGGGSSGQPQRKTVGKIRVDMAQFCSEDTAAVPQEVYLQLKPAGKLKVSIKATWLKDAKVDLDALTDVSVNTHRSADAGSDAGELDEQDLTGFDHLGEPSGHEQQQHRANGSVSAHHQEGRSSGSPRFANGSGSGVKGRLRAAAAEEGAGSPKAAAAAAAAAAASGVAGKPGRIPPFSVGPSPLEEQHKAALAQQAAAAAAFQQAELAEMRRTIEDQLRGELQDALARHSGRSWRDLFCCCCGRGGTRDATRAAPVTAELALRQESGKTLLASRADGSL